jgi:RHS repeat-associated protein
LAQPVLAGFTQDANGNPTHYNGIPIPPMQTAAEARAATEKRLAAIKAEEAKQAAQAAAELATRNPTPATAPQELFFTGKPYLEETGQYLFLFRHYDPELARWTTADPSGFPDGANNIAYMAVPTSAIDAQGLFSLQFYAVTEIVNTQPYVPEFALGIKTYHHFTVDVTNGAVSGEFKHIGWTGIVPGIGSLNRNVSLSSCGCNLTVGMNGWARTLVNPLLSNIDYDVSFSLNMRTGTLSLQGSHDGYPTYYIGVNGLQYKFDETTPSALKAPMEIMVTQNWNTSWTMNHCE